MTASEKDTQAPRQRPGGRSARVRAAVHRAVAELLTEGPAEALTIPVVAARAGVHPTTVYRRWPSLAELLADVAASRFSGDIVVPDTGSLRGDLERWVTDVAVDLSDPDVLALMRAAVGAAGPDGGDACVADRHAQLTAMLDRERHRGGSSTSSGAGDTSPGGADISHGGADTSHGGGDTSHGGGDTSHGGGDTALRDVPSTDETADALLGPLYYRAVFTARPGEPGWARGLVEHLLAGRT